MSMPIDRFPATWGNPASLSAKSFTCGWCDHLVAPRAGYSGHIYICPLCNYPTFFGPPGQVPGPAYGAVVEHVPPEVAVVYDEARECMTVNAYTAASLLLRKLLMHLA